MKAAKKVEAEIKELERKHATEIEEQAAPVTPYFNRELSWLEFNRRVLEEAQDQTHPLLERLKFLSIFSTNLDEFYMIRVSGLKEQLEESIRELSPDGLSPGEQLRAIGESLRPTLLAQSQCLRDEVLAELEGHDVRVVPYCDLSKSEKRKLDDYFDEHVYPILTPQAVDPSHPFPYISSLSLNLGVMIEPHDDDDDDDEEPRFARIKVPPVVPRLVKINHTPSNFALLEEVIAANIDKLFPGMRATQPYIFRVTRDADIEIEEDEADDLLRMMESELRRRRFGMAVRLEVEAAMPKVMVDYLTRSLKLHENDVFQVEGIINIPDLMVLYKLERPELKDAPLVPSLPAAFKEGRSIFDTIRRRDILLHHPYDSFAPVIDFIRSAVNDPDVVAIKMTLYRTGQPSPIVQALMDATERGKQVAVLVELKARFDEENNIEWARRLEQAGVHVVYGLIGLKTHSKIALVVRREGERLRRYCHIGTGNYNPATARLYTDLGLFTADEETGSDATELFNYLTGFSKQRNYQKLLIAPISLRDSFTKLIEREIEHHRKGRPARIIVKINSLTDVQTIDLLYQASQAGVPVDLIVRGVCMLRPGVKKMSENITVRSIVGRFLEHSRIFYFANGADDAGDGKNADIYLGSADWMRRNIDRRVELVTPVDDKRIKRRLKEQVLDVMLRDNVKARYLTGDGSYIRYPLSEHETAFDSQKSFIKQRAN
ncbi:MAG: polyphosphate kinase 1 [Pyrinomonadaceae bacterium MAG19_C2-C3]|nr:polyphosphate kinase 1 [Pyrinomonadaceae bacterium MAG19_C2-C3]